MCEGSDGFYFFQKPKRRRSSAQPVLGGATTKKTAPPTQLTVIEVSEPEEEELPAKKVGRTKKLVRDHFLGQCTAFNITLQTSAGAQGRRISHLVCCSNYSLPISHPIIS